MPNGVPDGCADYRTDPENKRLIKSNKEEIWRCAGSAKAGFGFELTQDEEDQQVAVLAFMPTACCCAGCHAADMC